MWSAQDSRPNDSLNQRGQVIRLYVPSVQFQGTKSTTSIIGGPSTTTAGSCSKCQGPLVQLVRFVVDCRTAYVIHACNSSKCWKRLFVVADSNNNDSLPYFHVGGDGVVICQRVIQQVEEETPPAKAETLNDPVKPVKNGWATSESDRENEFGEVDATTDLDDLEHKLASMEASAASTSSPSKTAVKPKVGKTETTTITTEQDLPLFKLSEVREPPPSRPPASDPDDVGLSTDSQDHIARLLQNYLEEEEDADLVQMLRGQQQGYGGGAGGEADEELSPLERARLAFGDRIQRLPKHVVRYTPGGVPLWSVPEPPLGVSIPVCARCGEILSLVFQVVPQILHVLRVDDSATAAADDKDTNPLRRAGGMEFGNLAVFACSSAGGCSDCLVVVQRSADDDDEVLEPRRNYNQAPAVPVDETEAVMGQDDDDGWEMDG